MSLQRERFELARSSLAKAKECADLLLVSLYVLIPPSRGLEIRTLEILPEEESLVSPTVSHKNLLQVDASGTLYLRFQNYKTKKNYGVDRTTLPVSHHLG